MKCCEIKSDPAGLQVVEGMHFLRADSDDGPTGPTRVGAPQNCGTDWNAACIAPVSLSLSCTVAFSREKRGFQNQNQPLDRFASEERAGLAGAEGSFFSQFPEFSYLTRDGPAEAARHAGVLRVPRSARSQSDPHATYIQALSLRAPTPHAGNPPRSAVLANHEAEKPAKPRLHMPETRPGVHC